MRRSASGRARSGGRTRTTRSRGARARRTPYRDRDPASSSPRRARLPARPPARRMPARPRCSARPAAGSAAPARARGGGAGVDDAGALLPRRSQGSNQGEARARLSGGSYETQPDLYEAHAQPPPQQQHAAASESAYAYQDGGAWAQAEDGNWYWYPADGGEPVPWTGDASAETHETAAVSNAAASAGTDAYAIGEGVAATTFSDSREAASDAQPFERTGTGTRSVDGGVVPPEASFAENDQDYDAQWQAALDAAYAAANDAEVAQARAEAEARAAREQLMLREAEVQALRQAAADAAERQKARRRRRRIARACASPRRRCAASWRRRAWRCPTPRLPRRRGRTARATPSAAPRRRACSPRRTPRRTRSSPGRRGGTGDDGMPGGAAGDAAGDATQARARGGVPRGPRRRDARGFRCR